MSSQGLSRRHVVVVRLVAVFLLVLVTSLAGSAFSPTARDMRPEGALDVEDTMVATPRRVDPRSTAGPVVRPEPPLPAIAARSLEVLAPVVTATKVDSLFTDVDGDTNADPGDVLQYVVTIGVTGMDATGMTFNDTIDPNTTLVPGSVNTSPLAIDDSYSAIGNVSIAPNVAQGMLANDTDADGNALTVTGVDTAGTQGQVTFNANGSFTFNPNPGFEGTTTFTYTISDGIATNTGTVSINVSGMIWFVNSAAGAGGDGRIGTPFNALTGAGSFNTVAADDPGDNIFLFSGAYTGGFTLLNNQRFIGAGASQTLSTITGLTPQAYSTALPATGGANPTVTSGGVTVTLGTGNRIQGMTFGNATTSDITGTSFGTLTVRDVTLDGTGRALDLTTGTLDAIFQSISSTTSATNGVILTTVGGSLSTTGGTTVTNATGIGIQVSTAPAGAALNFGNTSVTNPDGDTTGNTSVRLADNTGNVTFGSLNLTPETGQRGLHATHGVAAAAGTITSTSGAIAATNAIAIEVNRTTAGTIPLALSLTSVSDSGASSGIVLVNSSGSFTVNGDGGGANNGSGGTISGSTGSGIVLNNATNVNLRYMNIQSSADDGIDGTTVTGFTLHRCNVTNNGNALGDCGLDFGGSGTTPSGMFGTGSITNSTVSGSEENNIRVRNMSGTLSALPVTNCTVTGNDITNGNDGILFEAGGTASMALNVSSSSFSSHKGDHIQTAALNSGSLNVVIFDNTFTGGHPSPLGQGVTINAATGVMFGGYSGTVTYDINDNDFTGATSNPIIVNLGTSSSSAVFSGRIRNNSIGTTGVALSGSAQANGIAIDAHGNGTHTTSITNNTIRRCFDRGISVLANDGNGVLNMTVSGNIINEQLDTDAMNGTPREAFILVAGATTTNVFGLIDSHAVCLNLTSTSGNMVGGAFKTGDVRIRQRFRTSVALPGYTPPGGNHFDAASVITFLQGNNPGSTATVTVNDDAGVTTDGFFASGGCAVPARGEKVAESGDKTSDDDATEARAALRAALGARSPESGEVASLDPQIAAWLLPEAIRRLEAAGLTADEIFRLHSISIELADLPGDELVDFREGKLFVDAKAAGYEWFVDESPAEDSEFAVTVEGRELEASEGSRAYSRMDLFSAVTHVLCEQICEERGKTPKRFKPLLAKSLRSGVRRLPLDRRGELLVVRPAFDEAARAGKRDSLDVAPVQVVTTATVEPGAHSGNVANGGAKLDDERSGETIVKNIGTVPAGKTVTVTFRVTIDTPFPVGVCTVSNQGTISGSNFANVLTDDPAVAGAADPTMTTIPIPPVIGACPANITVSNTTGVCGAAVTFATPTATGCPVPTVTCVPASGSTFVIGTTTVTCTAANSVPPNSTCSFTVTVNDTQAPTVTCPANITQPNTAGQCSGVATFTTPAAVDNCPGATVVCVPASGSTFPIGVTTVTCTATDASANTGSCTFTVTINDTQAPTVACPANITMPAAAGLCSAVATYTTPTASDNCPGATVVCAPASGSSFPVGVTTVTCTATDASANTGTCSFTVTIQDTQAPTVTCPANITTGNTAGQCSAVVNFTTPTATDNCPGATVVCVPASGATFPVGSTTVTCTATDASANTGSCSFTVTVQDTQAPTVSCPANITQANTAGQCSAVVNYTTPTGADNCPGPVTVVCVPASGATFPVGTTTVTCTASDGSANSPDGTCTFTVTINDTQAPTVTCPANVVTPATAGQCSAVVNFTTPVASDNCPGATVVCVPASGSTFPVGSTTVTCTATDASSNTGSCSFSVTVNDTQAPTVTCPANITVVESPPSSGSATVTYTTPTASDNCPGATVNCLPASGSSFPVGTTTVTCTATDASANTGTCTFTITVQPACTITCPANVTTANDANQCGAVVNYPAPTTTGVCGTVTCVPASGSFFAVGTTTVNCSTTSGPTCSFTVTVNDTQAPVANCPAPVTVPNAAGQCSAVVSYTATASDNCPGATVACVPASGSTFPVGTTTVTCTATDAVGNTGTCSFGVTVQDTEAPAVTCPANMTVPKTPGQCSTVVNYTVPTPTDNCPGATASCTPASGSTFPVGVTTVTCTATDASPNSPDTTCTFTITVTDTTAPVITCPANVTVPNDANVCGATVKFADPSTSDNCPGTTVVCVPASGTLFAIGTTTVTCTATDASNNTSMCSFTVTVNDTQAPVASCPAPITVAAATGTCAAVVSYTATATDNCPGVTIVCAPASGSTFPVGVTTVNCTATDASGNMGTCSFTITVQDTQLPVITCPANITVTTDTTTGCTFSTVVTYPAPVATDNCGLASVVCVPPSGSTFNEGTTTVTCTATDTSGNTAACTFTVTVGAAFGFCSVDDATGNRFQMVVNPASPSYGVWRFTVVATNTRYCGRANYINYVPGIRLRAYDNDYSAENPTFFMDANFKTTAGTVTVRNVSGTIRLTLRDRNLADSVCP